MCMQCITCITIWCCKWKFVQNLYHLKLNVKIFYTKLFYPWVIFASLHFKIVLPRLEFAQAQLCVNKNNWDNGIHEVLKGHGHGFCQELISCFTCSQSFSMILIIVNHSLSISRRGISEMQNAQFLVMWTKFLFTYWMLIRKTPGFLPKVNVTNAWNCFLMF